MSEIDVKEFWRLIGQRATGVTVVTVDGKQGDAGFLGLSTAHVSAQPPTMLVSIGHSTMALVDILERKRFAINFLPWSCGHLIDVFGGKTDIRGADRFEPGKWKRLKTGCPVHIDALAAIDCELIETIDRVGTTIVLGNILAAEINSLGEPLVLYQGRPRQLR